jgi:hypothetical protein
MTQVTMITDPVRDDDSRRIVSSISGCRRVEGSPIVDGTPFGSRSVFEIGQADLAAGGLDARIDVLHAYGINVHRVVGDHPAVGKANRRLGYEQPSLG